MLLFRRRNGSQRSFEPIKLELYRITDERDTSLTFKGEDGVWYTITPETFEEMKTLLSEVHVIHHNWPENG
jgi:hypothetical protein